MVAERTGRRDNGRSGVPRWHWTRERTGVSIEVAPAALCDLLSFDERTARQLRRRLFELFDLALVHPAFAVAEPLQLAVSGRHVRYSLDLRGNLVVIERVDPA
jgi:hypothetical protein